ncbi:MAG: hypothetical protein ACKODK_13980 [Opitutaceae bacterium]
MAEIPSAHSPAPAQTGFRRRWLVAAALIIAALLPVWQVVEKTADARRNIVYWDEFDTALSLVLRLESGLAPADFWREIFAENNGHRLVMSRLVFTGIHAATGRINFAALDWIGVGAIAAAVLLAVFSAGGGARRLLLALLLSAAVFNLSHYENFLWSGSSIDHFSVVFIATAALAALAANRRVWTIVAVVLALIATVTLAHGLAVWPAGALLLHATRRPRLLLGWTAVGAAATLLFVAGLGSRQTELAAIITPRGMAATLHYWLSLLGAAPVLGWRAGAPYAGVGLLALLAITRRRAEPFLWHLAIFSVIGAAIIAAGRSVQTEGEIHSRYLIVGAFAWAIAVFQLIAPPGDKAPLTRRFALVLPCLAAFQFAANREFADEVDSWLTCRDLATVAYIQHGTDGRGPFSLHPRADHSTRLLRAAARSGIYELEDVCREESFPPEARESGKIVYHVEEVAVTARSAAIRGWVGIPGRRFARGAIHLVLEADGVRRVYQAVTVPRADVPAVMHRPEWDRAGFHFAREISDLPAGNFRIGLLVEDEEGREFVMTEATLRLPPAVPPAAQQ